MNNLLTLNKYRQKSTEILAHFGSYGNDQSGVFVLPSPIDGADLRCIASVGMGWEHVSVSRKNRCPNWPEMDFIKKEFFDYFDTVMQLHVPAADHINYQANCLHLWRPQGYDLPRPPGWMIGPKEKENGNERSRRN